LLIGQLSLKESCAYKNFPVERNQRRRRDILVEPNPNRIKLRQERHIPMISLLTELWIFVILISTNMPALTGFLAAKQKQPPFPEAAFPADALTFSQEP
jgi:hypothetical protein